MKIFAVKTRGHSPRTFTHAPCRTHVSHIKVYLRLQSPHNARARLHARSRTNTACNTVGSPHLTPHRNCRTGYSISPHLPKTAPSETAPRVLEGPTSGPSQLDAPASVLRSPIPACLCSAHGRCWLPSDGAHFPASSPRTPDGCPFKLPRSASCPIPPSPGLHAMRYTNSDHHHWCALQRPCKPQIQQRSVSPSAHSDPHLQRLRRSESHRNSTSVEFRCEPCCRNAASAEQEGSLTEVKRLKFPEN